MIERFRQLPQKMWENLHRNDYQEIAKRINIDRMLFLAGMLITIPTREVFGSTDRTQFIPIVTAALAGLNYLRIKENKNAAYQRDLSAAKAYFNSELYLKFESSDASMMKQELEFLNDWVKREDFKSFSSNDLITTLYEIFENGELKLKRPDVRDQNMYAHASEFFMDIRSYESEYGKPIMKLALDYVIDIHERWPHLKLKEIIGMLCYKAKWHEAGKANHNNRLTLEQALDTELSDDFLKSDEIDESPDNLSAQE